jgi:hypothetical protein
LNFGLALDGQSRVTSSKAVEDPGRYFNPLLGVLITGAAHLILGIAEKHVIDDGLDWAFCNTDSLAVIRPHEVQRGEFRSRANDIVTLPPRRIRRERNPTGTSCSVL